MVHAIVEEIKLVNKLDSNPHIDTIYFGGGTPSLLMKRELDDIMGVLHETFPIQPGAEVTLEANPDDISHHLLQEWKQIGINRLSVGVQSFDEDELRWMNRAHNAKDSLRCLDEITRAGFENFSADLIYGSPLSTTATLKNNLEIFIEKSIPHISCYALTVEPRTVLDSMIKKRLTDPVNENDQADQFHIITRRLKEEGYEHYEISNFAKPGFRSRHNSSYWSGVPYYGFGPAAHSFDGKVRRWNISNNALYIQSLQNKQIPFEEEVLSRVQQYNEYLMTALRTQEGINLEKIKTMYYEFYDQLRKGSQKFITNNMIHEADGHLFLTDEGKFLADGIASELFASDQ